MRISSPFLSEMSNRATGNSTLVQESSIPDVGMVIAHCKANFMGWADDVEKVLSL